MHFTKISESLHKEIGERPFQIRLDDAREYQDHYISDDSTLLKKSQEKMSEKFEIIGLNIINLQKFKTETQNRLDSIEKVLPKCFTIDQFREESHIQETRILKQINERLGIFQENLNKQKKDLSDSLISFNEKVDANEKETVWKINDCIDLLKTRVSDKYIDDAIAALDEKIIRKIDIQDEKLLDRLGKFTHLILSLQKNHSKNQSLESNKIIQIPMKSLRTRDDR